ncbi:glycosyltransferase [Salmonella enterica subsp. enterica]|nr:glycosyltransferase [Salmonella enterica subsp. enterica]
MVIPVYNEQGKPAGIDKTHHHRLRARQSVRFLLIDDGSSDSSAELMVKASCEADSHIILILPNRNYGQHAAIMAGLIA